MPTFSHLPLQQATYQKLTGDTTLMALITGVFDRPPQGSAFPYITLGESTIADRSTKTTTGTEQTISLHIWSREGGRAQTATVMNRIYQLLHSGSMTVTGQTLVSIRFFTSTLDLEDDGVTYHGTMKFRALLDAN